MCTPQQPAGYVTAAVFFLHPYPQYYIVQTYSASQINKLDRERHAHWLTALFCFPTLF